MSKNKTTKLAFYELVGSIEENFEVDTRVEECHGQHIFEDVTLIKRKLVDLKIVVGNKEIDILFKLSQEEIDLLLQDEI